MQYTAIPMQYTAILMQYTTLIMQYTAILMQYTAIFMQFCTCLYRHKPSRDQVELVGLDQESVTGKVKAIDFYCMLYGVVK